jgi:hypothetical protein
MLFVNITFIKQSFSDPFGWGWDFFGTANTPWHQFVPEFIPWFQAVAVLTGLYLSLRNTRKSSMASGLDPVQVLKISFPVNLFLTAVAVAMLLFFTN